MIRRTQAQVQQADTALDRIQQADTALDRLLTELRDHDPRAAAHAILGFCETRGDMTSDVLTDLGNRIGRMGHMRGRA